MAETQCYAMVRGSTIRVTGLGRKGSVPDPIQFAVSKSVAKVVINEVTTSGSDEMLGSEDNDNDNRLRLIRPEQTLNYTVDIDFIRVDPGVLSLITGMPLVYESRYGFGEVSFGEVSFGGALDEDSITIGFDDAAFGDGPFGGIGVDTESPTHETVVGFDSDTRRPPVSFALEVWSKLAGNACANGVPSEFGGSSFGVSDFGGGTPRQYGYTLFPYLKGGRLTGFEFKNGLVSFGIRGAQTRRSPRWGLGPYDLEGPYERLVEPVSRNTLYRQMLTTAVPPTEVCGIQETEDVIEGGTATVTSDDILDGGTAASTSAWAVEGGMAV